VGGSASRQKTASAQSKANHTSIKQHLTHSDHTFHQIAAKTDDGIVAAVSSAKTTTKQAIPLDDNDDFKDFNS
ncbi:MAG: hypothetical protein KAR47_13845, partial [Planctomycetes bacterium]|nr:hypothetical protein [Planctomycetota bacterium]